MKKKPTKALRIKARKVFAEYIKKRDGYKCVTCGKQMEKGDTTCHAGHFIHGNPLDFNEEANHCQCARCNTYLHGNMVPYTLYFVRCFGVEKVHELQRLKRIPKKFTREELEEIIERYK